MVALEQKWPVLGRHELAAEWLRIWADLGRAPRTIDAYARGLAEYLQVCEREGVDPMSANRAQVAVFVRELASRPSRRGTNVVTLDSGSGLANATLQVADGGAVLVSTCRHPYMHVSRRHTNSSSSTTRHSIKRVSSTFTDSGPTPTP
jgi:hypothetical protein